MIRSFFDKQTEALFRAGAYRGVPENLSRRASKQLDRLDAAARFGYPLAMKIESPDLPHKTEAGGVRLGVANAAEVRGAFDGIMANAARHAPGARIDGIVVQ